MYNLIPSATLDSRNLAMPNVFNNGHVAVAATVLLSREERAHRKKKNCAGRDFWLRRIHSLGVSGSAKKRSCFDFV